MGITVARSLLAGRCHDFFAHVRKIQSLLPDREIPVWVVASSSPAEKGMDMEELVPFLRIENVSGFRFALAFSDLDSAAVQPPNVEVYALHLLSQAPRHSPRLLRMVTYFDFSLRAD